MNKLKKAIVSVLILSLIVSCFGFFGISAETPQNTDRTVIGTTDYDEYLKKNSSLADAKNDIKLDVKAFTDSSADVSVEGDSLLIKENGAAEYCVNIPDGGKYNLSVRYVPVNKGETEIKFAFSVNGKSPFFATERLTLPTFWVNQYSEKRYDAIGNELTSPQVISPKGEWWKVTDNTGVETEPFIFSLSGGETKIRLHSFSCDVLLLGIALTVPEQILSYTETVKSNQMKITPSAKRIVIEGEDAVLKTGRDIISKGDNGSVKVSPNSYSNQYLNYIGGKTWSTPLETLYWEVEAEESGWYSIAFSYKQSEVVNGISRRWLKIDGETPFTEAKDIVFNYSTGWQFSEWENSDNKPYYVYLDKGKHTLSLSCTLSEVSKQYAKLNSVVESLGDKYTEIIMITGEAPDENRSYELFRAIPDFQETLKKNIVALDELVKEMQNQSGKRGSQYIAAMQDVMRVLTQMYDSPYLAHQYITDYYSSYTTLSSWLYEMKSMPLSIDRIYFTPYGTKAEGVQVSVFKSLNFGIMRFLKSFIIDYGSVSDVKTDEKLTIWINWGMDQARSLNDLIRDSFTESTGTAVEIKVVSTSLINGLMSGNFPDLVLSQTRTGPIDLGIRGALYDLKQFDDFEKVTERFMRDAVSPYEYGGKCYALPETQNFYMMFYRTDIFETLGLAVPKTWDEFIKATTVIQRNNMQVYLPYAAYTGGVALGGLSLYPTFMVQNNIPIFNQELTKAMIDSETAVGVFDYWTKLYTDYKYMKEADFYNRFRTASIPLGVSLYLPTYMQLSVLAPEIQGRWSLAPIPGFTADNHTVAGAGTGCSIVNKSKNKKQAWKFLKWWTSADTQVRYNNNIESILGSIERVATANVEALQNFAWKSDDLGKIMTQWENLVEIPQVPGGYYLARAIDQSYWEVINGQNNVKDALKKWNKIANSEIKRKIEQYYG